MGINNSIHDELKKALLLTKKIFDEHNIIHWLEYGSLLGCIRNGKLIAWDKDADLGIWYTDIDKVLKTERYFSAKDYWLRQDGNGNFTIGKRLSRGMVRLIDIFLFKKVDDWIIRTYRKQYGNKQRYSFVEFDVRSPARCYRGLFNEQHTKRYCTLEGEAFRVPNFAELSLEFVYGKTWRTPMKKDHRKSWGEDGRTHHLKIADIEKGYVPFK